MVAQTPTCPPWCSKERHVTGQVHEHIAGTFRNDPASATVQIEVTQFDDREPVLTLWRLDPPTGTCRIEVTPAIAFTLAKVLEVLPPESLAEFAQALSHAAAATRAEETAEAEFRADDERIDREYAAMEEHPGPEVAKAEAAYRGETSPKYAMLAPDAPQVYAEMLKAVEQVDELPDHRPDLAEMPHTITIERLDARTAREVNMSERAGLLVLVERHNGRVGKIMRITWQDMAETAAKNTAHVYGATYVPETDETDETAQADADAVAKAAEIRADPYYSGDDYAMFGDAE